MNKFFAPLTVCMIALLSISAYGSIAATSTINGRVRPVCANNTNTTSPIITFADANVKSICVANWDTNGDGELSEYEASLVTSLGTAFSEKDFTTFNELRFFTGLNAISEGAFAKSKILEVTIPQNVESLEKNAFLYCMSLSSLHIPANVSSMALNALSGCTAMTSITVDKDNRNYCDVDGVLFSADKTVLIQFPAAKSTAYTVPEGTTTIARDAFYMSKLETVKLPSSLKELVYDAFGWCRQLRELVIPEGVTVLGDYIADGCVRLTSLHIPASVTSIGHHICNGCKALTDVYSYSKEPFAIKENNFTAETCANAVLHVPNGLINVYAGLDGWKNFCHIMDDMTACKLSAEDLSVDLGCSAELIIGLSNNVAVDGVQFDLTLPAGISIATDGNGKYIIETTERSGNLYTECEKQGNGNYRIILLSTQRSVITPGQGGIISIKITSPKETTPGTYDVAFSSIYVSHPEGDVSVSESNDNFTSMLTINEVSTLRGDTNGDYEVNITDMLVIVDYVLGRPTKTFLFYNADLDNNGIINITDALNVVNIILGKASSSAPMAAMQSDYDLLRMDSDETGCQVLTAAGIPNITAMQMDVVLPADCRLNEVTLMGNASKTHQVMTHELDNGKYRVVVFSTKKELLDTDAAILHLGTEGRGGLVCAESIQCFDEQNKPILSSDINAVLTGITTIYANDDNDAPLYNISGQRVSKNQRGINILNGRKVIVR